MADAPARARARQTDQPHTTAPAAWALEPQLLRSFLAVAASGSITRAAAALHRTQPAVTASVRRLEEGFGEPLFTRSSRGVAPTLLGERLLPHAEALQRVMDGVHQLMGEVRALEGARLRVAASTTIALYWLPPLLARFCAAHPTTGLVVHTRNSRDAVRELRGGEVDLALVEAPAAAWAGLPPGLVAATPVHDDSLVLVVGPDHPLARRAAVAATDLAGLPFVGREAGSGTRDVIEEALRAAGVTLEVRHELGEPEAIKLAVRSGLGVTILSSVAVRAEVERGELAAVPIDHPGFARRFTLLHPPEGLASHAAWAFRTLATAAVTPRRQAPPTPGRRAAR